MTMHSINNLLPSATEIMLRMYSKIAPIRLWRKRERIPLNRKAFAPEFLLLLFMLFGLKHAMAQKQGNMWFFGDHAGLDFNSGSPVFAAGGQTYLLSNHNEGTASISDSAGNLLFYTNGEKIWDRNHQVMPNGDTLLGGASSTQSSLIIAQPGSSRFFYVFTTDDFFTSSDLADGLRYNVVDMCLNNGMGDVATGQKNILLHTPVAEKLTAVRHGNGTDYWVITHEYYSDAFYSYHLAANGIIDSVVSHIGSVHPTGLINTAAAIGQLKASPDGTKLALVNGNSSDNIAEYFSFDKNTGIVSNAVNIQWNIAYHFYGVSFSPDNSKLYVACILNGNGVYQFDLNAGGGDPDSVRGSRTLVTAGYNYNYQALQLAPDGKIYVTHSPLGSNMFLSVISNPNAAGTACNYIDNAIFLNAHAASYGLPNFIDSYDYSNGNTNCNLQAVFAAPHYLCPGTCTDFMNLSLNAISYQWSFPGASPNTSTAVNPSNICYNTPGNYPVTLIANGPSGSDTLTLNNYIAVFPQPAPQSITQNGDTLIAIAGATAYQWYYNGNIINGATDDYYIAQASGDYNVVATDVNGCEVEAVLFGAVLSAGDHKEEIENDLHLYPVPVEDVLKINFSNAHGAGTGAATIRIYNVLGEGMNTMMNFGNSKTGEIFIDCSHWSGGIYILEMTISGKIYRSKFTKSTSAN